MLHDLLSPKLISDTVLRVARDHMVQFARRREADLVAKAADRPGHSSLYRKLLIEARDLFRTYEAHHNEKVKRGRTGEPLSTAVTSNKAAVNKAIADKIDIALAEPGHVPVDESPASIASAVPPLDDEQFAALIATIDGRINADGADTMELAWLLTIKCEISRLRSENETLRRPWPSIEDMAKSIGLNRLRNNKPPVRWPADPNDNLSGRDGTVPVSWAYAEECREDARAARFALPSDPDVSSGRTGADIINVLAQNLQEAIKLFDDSQIGHPKSWDNALALTGRTNFFSRFPR